MLPESVTTTNNAATTNPALSSALAHGLAHLSLDLPATAIAQLLRYLDLIARWNRVYNLTAVRDPQDMLTQHLLDCLAIVPPLRRVIPPGTPTRVLDVGSGAGLPGVVLAITQPGWSITCVDTVAKKASFIRQVAAELALPNLTATHQRVETMDGQPHDLITCRAFASLADFITLSHERLAPQGRWVAMKARLTAEEREAVPADVDVFHVEPITVPGLNAERCLVWMRPRPAAA
ncbi:MAG TPA: 16S rRNA (guanine(527)-N(7))-methyltransferase RsmG [Ideonella sp.]|nr:16S rRNA (guanine(527)-N(7))-methyltransferase RsmG [Ideonella sp.]